MTDSTWDDYVDAGGVDSTELQDLSWDIGEQADVIQSTADDPAVGATDAEAMGDAVGDLRDAEWDTSTAAEWTAGAESDVDYADSLDFAGEQHLQGAADALAQGDIASAEWESAMADSSLALADDAMEQAESGLGVAGEHLSDAADEVGLATESLEGTGFDPGADTLDTSLDTGFDTGLDSGLDTSLDTGLDSGLDTGLDVGTDLASDDF